jgi:predicted nucleic acid-binding protein
VTAGFVADSSVGVAWAVPSQTSEPVGQLLDDVASGTLFVVPSLWKFEVANALLVLRRRQRIEPQQWTRARQALDRLTPRIDEEGPRVALREISDLASRQDLSVYDAVYLELALRTHLPLASRDASLNKAAHRCGVATLL